MILVIATILIYFLRFTLEVFHDEVLKYKEILIRQLLRIVEAPLKEVDDQTDSKNEWHRLDWWGHATLSILPGFLMIAYKYKGLNIDWTVILIALGLMIATSIMIGALRVLVLNIGLNLREENTKWDYLSSSGFEANFKGKEKLYYLGALLLFSTTATLLLFSIS